MKDKNFVNTFLAFMADPAGLTIKEIKAELKKMGIDYRGLKKRMKQIMKENKQKRVG